MGKVYADGAVRRVLPLIEGEHRELALTLTTLVGAASAPAIQFFARALPFKVQRHDRNIVQFA